MATIEIEIDEEKIQQLLQGDRGMDVLLEPTLNQIPQTEMTEHLKAEPGEETDDRRGYRNGTHERGERVRLSDDLGRHHRAGGSTRLRRHSSSR